MGSNEYKLSSKTAPGPNGERVFIKAQQIAKNASTKKQKASLSTIFGFLTAIVFIALILFSTFIGFIVFNANTVADVEFFRNNLGINLNDINNFIELIVGIIFSILLFIVTSLLSITLFKFLTTKKSLKQKKIRYGILSGILFFVTLGVGTGWMAVYAKVQNLPNWLQLERGNLQIFDNTLLINDEFKEDDAFLENTQNLIGPKTLKFDISAYKNDRSREVNTIERYFWDIS